MGRNQRKLVIDRVKIKRSENSADCLEFTFSAKKKTQNWYTKVFPPSPTRLKSLQRWDIPNIKYAIQRKVLSDY